MKIKPIQEFIIQNEENLRIAEAVAEALPEARLKMAVEFLGRLDSRLKASYPTWKSKHVDSFFRDLNATYCFWKPEWAGQYFLALQFAQNGTEMIFGVARERQKVGNLPFCVELLAAVKEVEAARRVIDAPDWEAQIRMESPAADWQKPEVLWRMRTDPGFLDDVAGQLLELAKISVPIVDNWVLKYKKVTDVEGIEQRKL